MKLVRESKTRAVKVTIEMNGFLMWSKHFTNYPTCKELLTFIPEARRTAPDARAFVRQLCSSKWVIGYGPTRIIQYVSSLGVVIGRIVMEEVSIFKCVGFDPISPLVPECWSDVAFLRDPIPGNSLSGG